MFALGCFWSRKSHIVQNTQHEEKIPEYKAKAKKNYYIMWIEEHREKTKRKTYTFANDTSTLSSWQLNEAFFTDINKSNDCHVECFSHTRTSKKIKRKKKCWGVRYNFYFTVFLHFFSFSVLLLCLMQQKSGKMEWNLVKRDELRLILRFSLFSAEKSLRIFAFHVHTERSKKKRKKTLT